MPQYRMVRRGYGFEAPEDLRAQLIRLHEAGPGAWRSDREAAE